MSFRSMMMAALGAGMSKVEAFRHIPAYLRGFGPKSLRVRDRSKYRLPHSSKREAARHARRQDLEIHRHGAPLARAFVPAPAGPGMTPRVTRQQRRRAWLLRRKAMGYPRNRPLSLA